MLVAIAGLLTGAVIPETHRGNLAQLATFALLGGFALMMPLDATLG